MKIDLKIGRCFLQSQAWGILYLARTLPLWRLVQLYAPDVEQSAMQSDTTQQKVSVKMISKNIVAANTSASRGQSVMIKRVRNT